MRRERVPVLCCAAALVLAAVVADAKPAPPSLALSMGSTAGVHVGDMVVQIDGVDRSLLPARVEGFGSGETHKVTVYDDSHLFTASLSRTAAGWSVSGASVGHCDPVGADWIPKGNQVTISLKKTGDWNCGASPATGVPDGRGKIAFASVPPGATVYYPKVSEPGFLTATSPATFVVNFLTNAAVTAFMKLPGYYDCAVSLKFSGPAASRTVTYDGRAQPISVDGTPASVACRLKPLSDH